MDCTATDLSDLFDWPPDPEKRNAAPAGTGNGVETSAAQKIAYAEGSKSGLENQGWAALEAARQWVAWREDDRSGKPAKVPYSSPQRMARSDDPATWLTRPQAEAVAVDLLAAGRKGGVGLVLGGEGDLRFGGIDLDSCLGLLGDLEPWAAAVLDRFPSYAEISPSGTGVKVFFRYAAEDLEPLRAIMGTRWGKAWSRGSHHEIALHLGNRYFTVTGQRLDSVPATIKTVDRAALEWLITDAGPRFKGDAPATAPKDESRSGRAFRLAGECRRAGLGLDDFRAELAKDPDLAAWAQDARQVQRAWDRTAGEDLSTVLDDMEDLPDLPEPAKANPVTALNRDHAAVMIGGKFRIVRETAGSFEVFPPDELHKMNANKRVKVPSEKRTEPITAAWMRHPQRREYLGGLVFNPKGAPAEARAAMRTQKMLDGVTLVNVVPRFLLVSPQLEMTAEKLLADIQAATVADVNPFGGKLSLLVEPRLTGASWYLFGNPDTAPVLEYAYLSSAQGPQLSSRDGWEVLGREFRVTLDFGCGATDWRGVYRNAVGG